MNNNTNTVTNSISSNDKPVAKKRLTWIDFAKGIDMLCIVTGHTLGNAFLVYFSFFAIPLFFILSGFTSRDCKSWDNFLAGIKPLSSKLIAPSFVITTIYLILRNKQSFSIINLIPSLLYSRCDDVTIGSYTVEGIGILWFLAALYSARIIYNLITLIKSSWLRATVITATTLVGIALGYTAITLPLNIDVAMSMQLCMYLGASFKKYCEKDSFDKNILRDTLISALGFFAFLFASRHFSNDYPSIAAIRYPAFPTSFISGIMGSFMIIYICIIISKTKIKLTIINFIGLNSLYLYFVHSLDRFWIVLWTFSENIYIQYISRLIIDLCLMWLITIIMGKIKKNKSK